MKNNTIPKLTSCFVSNSSFAVNAFLKNHIIVLSKKFNVILICNDTDIEINPSILEKLYFIE